MTEGHAGAGDGGDGPAAGEGGHHPDTGEDAGSGGISGAAGSWADAGSAGETFAGITKFWNCEQTGDKGSAGAGGAPSWPLPSSAEATLSQLVGDWAHDGTIDNNGDIDYFHFDADATGSQTTIMLTSYPEQWTTTYAGAIELANHEITLDSTAGTAEYGSFGLGLPGYSKKDLPHQVIRYGYSYDETTDTLYVNTASCSEPVRFARYEP